MCSFWVSDIYIGYSRSRSAISTMHGRIRALANRSPQLTRAVVARVLFGVEMCLVASFTITIERPHTAVSCIR